MNSIVPRNQSVFIKRGYLSDGVVIGNEVVELVKHTKKECVIFKVDFEKTYDSVSWTFLDYMNGRMGFGKIWKLR
jgi:hypothetical protein